MLIKLDIVMQYAFSRHEDRVGAHDFDPSFKEAGEAGAKMGHLVKQMPWLLHMRLLPDSFQMMLNPTIAAYLKLNQVSFKVFPRFNTSVKNQELSRFKIAHLTENLSLPSSGLWPMRRKSLLISMNRIKNWLPSRQFSTKF
jgi:hypothetical protein